MKKLINFAPIAFAAFAAGMLWVNVFALFHSGVLAYVGGIPAGVSIVWLVVNAANSLPRVQSKRARQAGWFFLGLVVIVEPLVLWSANYPLVTKTTITPLAANIVSGGASLAITLSLIMAALVERSLIPAEKPQFVAQSAQTPKKSRNGAKKSEEVQESAPQSVAPVAVVQASASKYPHECGVNGCMYIIRNAQSVGGHMKAKHPASLGIFEPIKQEQTK